MKRYFFYFFTLIQSFLYGADTTKDSCPELTGRVVLPTNSLYEQSRLVSNYFPSKNSRPKAIVYAQNAQDVQNAVKWARCQKLPIRVRSGGHSHEGYSTGSDALVIDVSEMKSVQVDKAKGIATLQPGITGGELYRRLAKDGLTQVGGTCEGVGVSGLVLTGGMGFLGRIHGLTCDNLISFEMVNAEGKLIKVTNDNEYKDLFWAACGGGGGNFGVVTSIVMKVYPSNKVTWFNIGWDWEQPVEKIIAAWQDFFIKADNKWFSHLDLWAKAFPKDKYKKQPIKMLGVFYGSPEDAKKGLAPLLSIVKPTEQTIELVDWVQAIKLFEESTATYITDKPEYKSSGAFVMKPFPPEAIRTIVDTLKQSNYPLLNVLFLGLGGAIKDKAPNATAYFYRGAEFLAVYSTQWMKDSDREKQVAEIDALRERLLPYTKGDYIGNPDRNLKDYMKEYYGDNAQRLRAIKKKYDPDNLFRFEQSIPPAA